MKSTGVLVAVAAMLTASPALAADCSSSELAQVMAAQNDASIKAACTGLTVDASKPMALTNLDFCKSDGCQTAIKKVVAGLPDCSVNGISITVGTAALLGKCSTVPAAVAKDPTPPPVPTRPDGSPVPVPTGADGRPLPPPNGAGGPPPENGPGTVSPPNNNSAAPKKEETPVPTTVKPTNKPNTTVSGQKETANATNAPTGESTTDDAGYEETEASSASKEEEETTINVPGGGDTGSAESVVETPKPSSTTPASLSPRVSSSLLVSAISAVAVMVMTIAVSV